MFTVLFLAACGSGDPPAEAPTYHQDARAIIDRRCATCHRAGDIAPFPLTTYEEVAAMASVSALAVESGRMPPFLPSHDCNDYATDYDLTPAERDTLLAFFEAEAPEGDPASSATDGIPDPVLDADLVVTLPEPYTPTLEPDDYRCQLIDLDLEAPTYVTAFQVWPDQRAIVHHNITFVIPAELRETFLAYDDADPGPGWTCFGGPTGEGGEGLADMDTEEILDLLSDPEAMAERASGLGAIGGWVPGAVQGDLPEGTGILLRPGDSLVVQMHYNTLSAAPVADQSQIAFKTASSVPYPATTLPLIDPAWVTGIEALGTPMDIPAGDPDASAETVIAGDHPLVAVARDRLGAAPDAPLRIHAAGVHMHTLGTDGRIDLLKGNGEDQCVIHYPAWDFAWQGSHQLTTSLTLGPDDALRLACRWDNSAENQVVVDGEQLEPRDVTWGEGTTDEMCLGNLYVTL